MQVLNRNGVGPGRNSSKAHPKRTFLRHEGGLPLLSIPRNLVLARGISGGQAHLPNFGESDSPACSGCPQDLSGLYFIYPTSTQPLFTSSPEGVFSETQLPLPAVIGNPFPLVCRALR